MFGNVPRALWERWIPADERHRIPLACRAMLVEDGDRKILFETGVGAFFPPKLRDRFGVMESDHVLLDNLNAIGWSEADIDVVVLSHLHFDHAGGVLKPYVEGEPHALCFPNASFVVGKEAWDRARAPHQRDRASFIKELPALLEASGRLEVVEGDRSKQLGDDYRLHYSHGHTPGLMLAEIPSDEGPIVFAADLIPGTPWVHLPITMGYDRYPEMLIDEKHSLLSDLITRGGRLFFTHDHAVCMGTLAQDDRGRFDVEETHAELRAFAI